MEKNNIVVYLLGPDGFGDAKSYRQHALAQEEIDSLGFSTINPHELCESFKADDFATRSKYIEACERMCISGMVLTADKVVTLDGWEQNAHAMKMVGIARATKFIEVNHIIGFLHEYKKH